MSFDNCCNHHHTEDYCCCEKPEPLSTADISSAYLQNKKGRYFVGQGQVLTVNSETPTRAYYVLKNPQNSRTNLFLNLVEVASLSPTALRVNVYLCGSTVTGLTASTSVRPGNSGYCANVKNIGELYSGTELDMTSNGVLVKTLVLDGYTTLTKYVNGSILLDPTAAYIVEVEALPIPGGEGGAVIHTTGDVAVSFSWWEDPVSLC